MVAGCGVYQLGTDPYPRRCPPDATLYNIANAKLRGDRADIDRPALIREARVPRDHQKSGYLGEISNQIFSKALSEISLLRIVAHVDEGQDRDRRIFGERQYRRQRRR